MTTIDEINALDPKELADLNRRLSTALAVEMVIKPVVTYIAAEAIVRVIVWLVRRRNR